ncbi:MAG: DUF4255 domain-containing protein [Caldilineaceae bacterium]
MITDFNKALRSFLVRELGITNNAVEIDFAQPQRAWSQALAGPTLNLFLHDLRENNKLRGRQPGVQMAVNGYAAIMQRQPLYMDLHYMITAWTKEPSDEFELLQRTLVALFRYGELPQDLVAAHFPDPEVSIPFKIAQYDTVINPRDIWSVLNNEMRAAIDLVATVPLNPYQEFKTPLVREVETRYDLSLRRQS